MYQTTDQKLRKSILAQNMSYQDSVGWGQSHEESNRKATLVEETTDRPEDEVRRLEVAAGQAAGQAQESQQVPDLLQTGNHQTNPALG